MLSCSRKAARADRQDIFSSPYRYLVNSRGAGAMSIYATLWRLRFPRTGDSYDGCEWLDVLAQGVPAHIGTPTPGYGYEAGEALQLLHGEGQRTVHQAVTHETVLPPIDDREERATSGSHVVERGRRDHAGEGRPPWAMRTEVT